ncbi:MAG: hypothetical protein AB8E15_11490 [Bdellovibrionales bacterium]
MSHWIKHLFISFLYLLVSPTEIHAEDGLSCQSTYSISTKNLTRSFEDLHKSQIDYKKDHCHVNVISLFENLQFWYPDIKKSDVKVLFISDREFYEFIIDKKRVLKRDSIKDVPTNLLLRGLNRTDENKNYLSLFFHVVLEYKGLILDLDLPKGTPLMSREQYFKEVNYYSADYIRKNPSLENIVLEIPGNKYLSFSKTELSSYPGLSDLLNSI